MYDTQTGGVPALLKEEKALAKLAKIVKNVMAYTPPPGSLKKPVKAPSKAELSKGWKLKM